MGLFALAIARLTHPLPAIENYGYLGAKHVSHRVAFISRNFR